MIHYKLLIGAISIFITIMQYGVYIKDIWQGKTCPHAFSWFAWGLPTGVIFLAQLIEGGGAGSWATALTAILCTIIFILSLFYGEKEITSLDFFSLLVILFSISLWVITKNPLTSVILITLIDLAGFVPTIRKSIHKPYEETMSSYMLGTLKWILSLIAFSNFSFTICLYPVAMIFANSTMFGTLMLRRRAIRI